MAEFGYINENGLYYEGEKAKLNDIKVSKRPTPYHKYDFTFKKWIIDENQIMKLKESILNELDKELKKRITLFNLSDSEKEELNKKYEEKLLELKSINDPVILQEIKL